LPPPRPAPLPYTTRFRSGHVPGLQRQEISDRLAPQALLDDLDVAHELHRLVVADVVEAKRGGARCRVGRVAVPAGIRLRDALEGDRKSTRLNSSHQIISY